MQSSHSRIRRRGLAAAVAGVAVIAALVACSPTPSTDDGPQVLRFGMSVDFAGLNPAKEETLMAVLSEGHPLAVREVIAIEDLAQEPLVMFRRGVAPAAFQAITGEFTRAGIAMDISYELGTMFSVINFVAAGGGCGILPGFASQVSQEGVVFRPLLGLETRYTLGIVKRHGPVGPADRFFEHTIATIKS